MNTIVSIIFFNEYVTFVSIRITKNLTEFINFSSNNEILEK